MSTVDRVERSVLDELLRGDLVPGTRIRQDALAAELGVSKIPVREALQRLAAVGLLQFETNRGATVPALSVAEALEIAVLREAIEVQLLRQAVSKLTIVDLAEAELALSYADMGVAESNWAFHRALYRASGWTRGLTIVEILHAAVAPYVLLYVDSLGGAEDSDAEHAALLESCRAGDVETAVELLQSHLSEAAEAVIDFLATTEATAGDRR
jgi:DNA-binding GntR family transcriptional regulator